MDKRFRLIPKVSSKETPSLTQTEGVSQVLKEAGNVLLLADSDYKVALAEIEKLCKENSQNALLWRIQADVFEIGSIKATSSSEKEGYLQEAKRSIREAYELSHRKSMVYSSYLGYLMNKSSNDAETCIQAMDQLNESLQISNPIDPIESDILFDNERNMILQEFPTPVERIENCKKEILQYLGQCVLKLKSMGTNPSFIKKKLQELQLQKEEKVKLYWISLTTDEKKKIIPVKDLLFPFKNLKLNQVFVDAISFCMHSDTHEWKYWICCSCNETSPNPTLNLHHITTTHLRGLFSQLNNAFPLVVDHNGLRIKEITGTTWRPLILEEEWKLQIQASCTFEWLREVNPYSLVRDHECERLLQMIQEHLRSLVSSEIFLAAHMNILIQRSMMMLESTLGGYLRHLGLDQHLSCLCHLNANQLEDIFNLLRKMSDFTVELSEPRDEQTLDSSMLSFKLNGSVSLSSNYAYLVLDEHSLAQESPSGNSSAENVNDRYISVPPYVDDLVTWVYSDHSSDECLQEWTKLLEERRCLGKKAIDKYEERLVVSLSNVQNCNESESNNDSELTNVEKQTLRVAVDMHQLGITLNLFAAYDYQPIVLSFVKQYLKEYMEGIIDSTMRSDGAAADQIVADWRRGPRG